MDYCSCRLKFIVAFSLVVLLHVNVAADDDDDNVPFWQNYGFPWGTGHAQVLDQNTQVQLSLDQFTGSAAFESLQKYGSGWFSLKIKLPQKDSTGVITTFYLRSDNKNGCDEIDFEFLGGTGDEKHPYVLHTNIYTNGIGGREQRVRLWFDPTLNFHNYTLLWNSHQLVSYVDEIPIRVFKNTTKNGGSFPTQAMNIIGSIWNSTWASAGAPVNWTDAPFVANYRGFGIHGCQTQITNDPQCYDASKYWWNAEKYWSLDAAQMKAYRDIRSKYLVYDYCSKSRAHYPECQYD